MTNCKPAFYILYKIIILILTYRTKIVHKIEKIVTMNKLISAHLRKL